MLSSKKKKKTKTIPIVIVLKTRSDRLVQPVDQELDLDRSNQNWKNQHSAKKYWSKLKKN